MIKGFTWCVSLTSTGLQSYTSHKPALAAPWCLGRCCRGAIWPFWWPHLHAPDKPPGQACLAWAGGWGRIRWQGSQHPSCSRRCTGKGCGKANKCWNIWQKISTTSVSFVSTSRLIMYIDVPVCNAILELSKFWMRFILDLFRPW